MTEPTLVVDVQEGDTTIKGALESARSCGLKRVVVLDPDQGDHKRRIYGREIEKLGRRKYGLDIRVFNRREDVVAQTKGRLLWVPPNVHLRRGPYQRLMQQVADDARDAYYDHYAVVPRTHFYDRLNPWFGFIYVVFIWDWLRSVFTLGGLRSTRDTVCFRTWEAQWVHLVVMYERDGRRYEMPESLWWPSARRARWLTGGNACTAYVGGGGGGSSMNATMRWLRRHRGFGVVSWMWLGFAILVVSFPYWNYIPGIALHTNLLASWRVAMYLLQMFVCAVVFSTHFNDRYKLLYALGLCFWLLPFPFVWLYARYIHRPEDDDDEMDAKEEEEDKNDNGAVDPGNQ